jgi:hypothetical protein
VLSSSSSEEQLQVHGPLSSDGQSFSGIGGGRLADIGESGTSLAGEHGTCGVSRGFPSASLSAVSMAGVAHVALSVEAMMAAVLIVLIAIVLGLRCPCRLADADVLEFDVRVRVNCVKLCVVMSSTPVES